MDRITMLQDLLDPALDVSLYSANYCSLTLLWITAYLWQASRLV